MCEGGCGTFLGKSISCVADPMHHGSFFTIDNIIVIILLLIAILILFGIGFKAIKDGKNEEERKNEK